MANSFMQIPELPGLPTDPYKGWIPIKSISHGIAVEISKFDRAAPRQLGHSEHSEITVKKNLDAASLPLRVFCSEGRMIPEVAFAFSREDEKDIYLKLELKQVYVSEMEIDVDDGEDPEESIKLNYQTIDWKFRPKLKGGKLGDWMQTGWDRLAKKPTTPVP
jgi:type VI secretion system Hcp family effector